MGLDDIEVDASDALLQFIAESAAASCPASCTASYTANRTAASCAASSEVRRSLPHRAGGERHAARAAASAAEMWFLSSSGVIGKSGYPRAPKSALSNLHTMPHRALVVVSITRKAAETDAVDAWASDAISNGGVRLGRSSIALTGLSSKQLEPAHGNQDIDARGAINT